MISAAIRWTLDAIHEARIHWHIYLCDYYEGRDPEAMLVHWELASALIGERSAAQRERMDGK